MKTYNIKKNDVFITIPIPENMKDRVQLARSDCFRMCGEHLSVIRMLRNPNFRFHLFLRLSSNDGFLGEMCLI